MIWYRWRQFVLVTVTLAGATFLAADLFNLFLGATLEASTPPLRPPAPADVVSSAPPDVDAILRGNLFQPDQRGNNAEPSSTETPPSAVESTHQLVGTVTGSGSFGFAILEEKNSKTQSLYRLNDLLPGGGQLVEIERYEIVVQVGSRTQRLRIAEDVPMAGSGGAPGAPSPAGVRAMSDNHWLIERSKVDAALANLPQLLTQARLIPNFIGGKSDGFRLVSINPNSFFADIGLQEGDVLERINGVEVKDPQNLLKAFEQLRNEANINVDVQRQSQPMTLAYEIR